MGLAGYCQQFGRYAHIVKTLRQHLSLDRGAALGIVCNMNQQKRRYVLVAVGLNYRGQLNVVPGGKLLPIVWFVLRRSINLQRREVSIPVERDASPYISQ